MRTAAATSIMRKRAASLRSGRRPLACTGGRAEQAHSWSSGSASPHETREEHEKLQEGHKGKVDAFLLAGMQEGKDQGRVVWQT